MTPGASWGPGRVNAGLRRCDRPGDDEHPLHGVRPFRPGGRPPSARAPADPAACRLGGARPAGDLGTRAHRLRAVPVRREPRAVRPGRDGRDQPAGDHRGLGQDERPSAVQRDRLAGHPHRPDRGRAGPGRPRSRHPAPVRLAAGDVLLGGQDPMDSGPCRRRACGGRAGGRPVRHYRHLAVVEPDRRPGGRRPRHGRHQREPHHAHGSGDARLGRRTAVVLRHPTRDAARDPGVVGSRRSTA